MNPQHKRKQAGGKQVRRSLAAAALAALVTGQAAYAAPVAAAPDARLAAAPQQNAPVVSDVHYAYSFTDPQTGESFYNVMESLSDNTWQGRVLTRSRDGEWGLLPAVIAGLSRPVHSAFAAVLTQGNALPHFDDVYYDAAADELVDGSLYENAPSGKWGLRYILHFEKQPAPGGYDKGYGFVKKVTVLAKNNQNGVIRQIGEYPARPEFFWLPDGTMLAQRYSQQDRQNEIVRIDPDDGRTERLLLGSLRAYEDGQNLILFARNEPTRTPQIYDLRTGQVRAADKAEAAAMTAQFQSRGSGGSDSEPAAVPAGLDLASLPTAAVSQRQWSEGTVLTGGKRIPVPYLFYGLDRQLYVPVLPLIAALGWKAAALPGDEYSYAIATEHGTLRADKTNSMIVDERLFVRLQDIRAAGYTDFGIEWTAPPA